MSMINRNKNWSDSEVEDCVSAYLEHLVLDIKGEHFVKSHLYRKLADTIPRSEKSIEYKFQNISAVLDKLGLEWIQGLAPLNNFQNSLIEAVEKKLPDFLRQMGSAPADIGFEDMASFYIGPAPERASKPLPLPEKVNRIVRKFDPIERDKANKALGDLGEEFALQYERHLLIGHDREDLAKRVRWVSKEDGDGAGYDIKSYEPNGREKFIEVKTTVGGNRTPFYISRNETDFSRETGDRYRLVRLYNFRRQPLAFEMIGSIDKYVRLTTEQYRADFEA